MFQQITSSVYVAFWIYGYFDECECLSNVSSHRYYHCLHVEPVDFFINWRMFVLSGVSFIENPLALLNWSQTMLLSRPCLSAEASIVVCPWNSCARSGCAINWRLQSSRWASDVERLRVRGVTTASVLLRIPSCRSDETESFARWCGGLDSREVVGATSGCNSALHNGHAIRIWSHLRRQPIKVKTAFGMFGFAIYWIKPSIEWFFCYSDSSGGENTLWPGIIYHKDKK